MKEPIHIADNSSVKIADSVSLEDLRKIATPQIEKLCTDDNQSLLIFPRDFNIYGDDIGKGHILTVHDDNTLQAGNIMGFIGTNDTRVRIHSRFCREDGQDYFLHYMLQKVLAINLFDLNYNTDQESVFNFLIYLFPTLLKNAVRQGIFKEYQTKKYNDTNVRGRIDVGRHIRMNIPFAGKIAYTTREYAYDNRITQLVRHTIEYISRHLMAGGILQNDEDTIEAVRQIKEATPTYEHNRRREVINQNIKLLHHPYFSEYRHLQQLCLQILRHEEIKYGNQEDEIYGILFDGAWLWEEYLNTLLNDLHFEHPQNKVFRGRRNLFKDGSGPRYPDFYKQGIVLDAKYKGYGNTQIHDIAGDDLHQIITYMYIEKATLGGFIVPLKAEESPAPSKVLRGHEGIVSVHGLHVCQDCTDFVDFKSKMQKEEEQFKQAIAT